MGLKRGFNVTMAPRVMIFFSIYPLIFMYNCTVGRWRARAGPTREAAEAAVQVTARAVVVNKAARAVVVNKEEEEDEWLVAVPSTEGGGVVRRGGKGARKNNKGRRGGRKGRGRR
jgi:hypothetical protein